MFKKYLLITIVCSAIVATAQPAAADGVASQLTKRGYALLIGVSAYTDTRWPALPSVRQEIAQLQNGLAPHFAQVAVLLDPTIYELELNLKYLFQNIGSDPNQRLFVYYAGHGFTDTNPNTGEEFGYITGRDTPEYGGDRRGALTRAISMVDIDAIARSASALQALMVFDSCFSGNIFVNRGPVTSVPLSNQNISDFLRKPVRSYITAGGANQEIPENSPIATLLLRGIDGDADKYHSGFVTATDLGIYLRNTAPSLTGNLITPQFGKSPSAAFTGGEFVFLEIPKLPTLLPPNRPLVFLVFFDWDKDAISPEGINVLQAAADHWRAVGGQIEVTGYDDTSQSADEAQSVSEHRAANVASVLRRFGVSQDSMTVSARGQNDPRVPTGPGVREPQNRRVELVLQ